jgi:hypothetical protein
LLPAASVAAPPKNHKRRPAPKGEAEVATAQPRHAAHHHTEEHTKQDEGRDALADSKHHRKTSDEDDTDADDQFSATANVPFKQATNGSTPAGWVQIGTPKKWLLVIFDTGSDKLVAKTWETVSSELATIDQGISGLVEPSALIYNHNTSTSYRARFIKDPLTGDEMPRQSSITYGSGTAITDVGSDIIHVGNRDLKNFTLMEITADSLQLLHTSKGLAGVLGLQHMKNKSLGNSLFSQLRDNDLMTSFGYCRGTGNNGTFIWGDSSEEGTELQVIGQMHWAVKLGSISIGANPTKEPMDSASDEGDSLIEQRGKSWPFDDAESAMDDARGPAADSDGEADTSQEDGSASSDSDQDTAEKAIANVIDKIAKEMDHPPRQKVRHEVLDLDDACPDGTCTAILDTGSNILAGPTEAMRAITLKVDVKPDCSNFDELPHIQMVLGGKPVSIPPSGYVMKIPMPQFPMGMGGGSSGMDDSRAGRGAAGEAGGEGEGAGEHSGDGARADAHVAGETPPRSDDADGEAPSAGFDHETEGENAEFQDDRAAGPVDVIIEVHPGYVRRHRPKVLEFGLAEESVVDRRAATHRKWMAVFERLNRNYGIDLRDIIKDMLNKRNGTNPDFMCMPALVPLDKKTAYGPLWVVGTPLLDAYYARWSFAKTDKSPKIHLKTLQDAEVCKDDTDVNMGDSIPASALVRSEKVVGHSAKKVAKTIRRGPTERLPEEIRYPHWAKDLLHV